MKTVGLLFVVAMLFLPFLFSVRHLFKQLARQAELGSVAIDLGPNYTREQLRRSMIFTALSPIGQFVVVTAVFLVFFGEWRVAIVVAGVTSISTCLHQLFVGSRSFGRIQICDNGILIAGDGLAWDDIGRYGWTAKEGEKLFLQTWSGAIWEGRTIRLHVPAERRVEVDLVLQRHLVEIERVGIVNPSPGPSPR